MRRRLFVVASLVLLASQARAEELPWPGVGVLLATPPAGWQLAGKAVGEGGFALRAQPKAGPAASLQVTVIALPQGKEMSLEELRAMLQQASAKVVEASVEKRFEPQPLRLSKGRGWVVQLSDASMVGKPPTPGEFRMIRSAVGTLDAGFLVVVTLLFEDARQAEVEQALALVAGLAVDRRATPAAPGASPLELTVPESRVLVRLPDVGLTSEASTDPSRRYFMLSRREPQLILSAWLEPAEAYRGLEAFWASETRSPAYAGAGAPTNVAKLKEGAWEVVAFDIPVPGGTSAHLRAERVQAGTWIDLHLSSTASRPAAALREELLGTLRAVQVLEK